MQPKMHLIHSNNNYKVICRLRPQENRSSMLEISENNIIIKDPSNRASSEKQLFNFSSVFDELSQQELLFKYVCDHALTKIIEGHNSCVLSYGQTGSGKSFTIFGEDERYSSNLINFYKERKTDRKGLVPKTIEYLFKRGKELEEIREFVISCSMVEIYLDQVRDLGRSYSEKFLENRHGDGGITSNGFDTENLEIVENTNGQIQVKNVSQVVIKTMEDLFVFLDHGFKLRDRFDNKRNQLWARAHTIFTINLVQKDKENENLPFMNATIQFVDLAGSERIAKSLTEGHKFQEAILINTSLTAVSKCLLSIAQSASKNIPYKESKLTRSLQNCLSSICHVILIANINANENNFEECLSTLQFAERTKNIDIKTKGGGILEDNAVLNMAGNMHGADKMLKKLNEEIAEHKVKIDNMQREHRQKLVELKNILGLEIEMDKLLSNNQKHNVEKDLKNYRLQRQALEDIEKQKKDRDDLYYKIERNKRQIQDMEKEEFQKQERLISQILEIKEQNKRLMEQIQINKMNAQDAVRNVKMEKDSDIKNLVKHTQVLIHEKNQYLDHLPLEQKTFKKKNEHLEFEKHETKELLDKMNYKNPYKGDLEKLKIEFENLVKKMKEKYEFFTKTQKDEIEEFISQTKKNKIKLKEDMKELKIEMFEIYEISLKQSKILEKIEHGHYSAGIKSFTIPNSEKAKYPNRKDHNILFKLLDSKHTKNTIKKFENTEKKEQLAEAVKEEEPDDEKAEDLEINPEELSKLPKGMIKHYKEAIKIKKNLRVTLEKEAGLREKIAKFDQKLLNIDVTALVKEIEEYKKGYEIERKKESQIVNVIDSQKKYISMRSTDQNFATKSNNFLIKSYKSTKI